MLIKDCERLSCCRSSVFTKCPGFDSQRLPAFSFYFYLKASKFSFSNVREVLSTVSWWVLLWWTWWIVLCNEDVIIILPGDLCSLFMYTVPCCMHWAVQISLYNKLFHCSVILPQLHLPCSSCCRMLLSRCLNVLLSHAWALIFI